ncbi:hypothetical protein RDI58_005885 [Solanum bulbocastanum]|uniref:Uncharacterized protein n=1 Tax=Solanum bulbocastanum TaxID=147425 RepID=A0AAN8TZW9_SOLBU
MEDYLKVFVEETSFYNRLVLDPPLVADISCHESYALVLCPSITF